MLPSASVSTLGPSPPRATSVAGWAQQPSTRDIFPELFPYTDRPRNSEGACADPVLPTLAQPVGVGGGEATLKSVSPSPLRLQNGFFQLANGSGDSQGGKSAAVFGAASSPSTRGGLDRDASGTADTFANIQGHRGSQFGEQRVTAGPPDRIGSVDIRSLATSPLTPSMLFATAPSSGSEDDCNDDVGGGMGPSLPRPKLTIDGFARYPSQPVGHSSASMNTPRTINASTQSPPKPFYEPKRRASTGGWVDEEGARLKPRNHHHPHHHNHHDYHHHHQHHYHRHFSSTSRQEQPQEKCVRLTEPAIPLDAPMTPLSMSAQERKLYNPGNWKPPGNIPLSHSHTVQSARAAPLDRLGQLRQQVPSPLELRRCASSPAVPNKSGQRVRIVTPSDDQFSRPDDDRSTFIDPKERSYYRRVRRHLFRRQLRDGRSNSSSNNDANEETYLGFPNSVPQRLSMPPRSISVTIDSNDTNDWYAADHASDDDANDTLSPSLDTHSRHDSMIMPINESSALRGGRVDDWYARTGYPQYGSIPDAVSTYHSEHRGSAASSRRGSLGRVRRVRNLCIAGADPLPLPRSVIMVALILGFAAFVGMIFILVLASSAHPLGEFLLVAENILPLSIPDVSFLSPGPVAVIPPTDISLPKSDKAKRDIMTKVRAVKFSVQPPTAPRVIGFGLNIKVTGYNRNMFSDVVVHSTTPIEAYLVEWRVRGDLPWDVSRGIEGAKRLHDIAAFSCQTLLEDRQSLVPLGNVTLHRLDKQFRFSPGNATSLQFPADILVEPALIDRVTTDSLHAERSPRLIWRRFIKWLADSVTPPVDRSRRYIIALRGKYEYQPVWWRGPVGIDACTMAEISPQGK